MKKAVGMFKRSVFLCTMFIAAVLLSQEAAAESIRLPLEKFTAASSLEIRCIQGGQNLSVPIPERWDVHKMTLYLHSTSSNTIISDISQLAVRFNGEQVAQMKLNSLAPTVDVEIPLPVAKLESGYSTITFQVAQHYAANGCEQPCSSGLWTNISVRDSSLQIDYDLKPLPLRLGETTNMMFDPKQFPEMNVNMVMDVSTPESVTMAAMVASGIARHFDYRKVKFSHSSDIVDGTDNVLIGEGKFVDDVLAKHGIALAPGDGGKIKLFHLPKGEGTDNRHALVVVTGKDEGTLKVAAETFANMSLPYPGTEEMSTYEFSMPDISMYGGRDVLLSEKEYTFKDLGMPTYSFYGFSGKPSKKGYIGAGSEITFRLPPDFLIKQNQYAKLVLNFSYGAGLRPDSAMTVSVNDVAVRDIHLDNIDGNYIEKYEISIPTYMFKPGSNTIAFKPFLNVQRNVCDAVNTDGLFVTIFESSTFMFPPMPHFVELPRVDLFALNGFPFTRWPDGYETLIYLPQHDSAAIDTALNLLGMITQRNGFPMFGAKFAYEEPKDWKGEILAVGKVQDIPASLMAHAPFKFDGISTIPYPVVKGWDTDTSITLSKQKGGLGEGSGLLMEFESPIKSGRSVVLVTAQDDKNLLTLGDALLHPGIQARLKGDVALIRLDVLDYDLHTMTIGDKYSTGDKGDISTLDSFLFSYPSVRYGLIVLTIILLGAIGYWLLRRHYGKRIQGGQDKA